MNEYARFARNAWETLTPTRFEAMEDPSRFFSELGEQAQLRVDELTRQLQGPDVPREATFDKVGRIEAARMQAEEVVRKELPTPPEDLWEDEEEPMSAESQRWDTAMSEIEAERQAEKLRYLSQ